MLFILDYTHILYNNNNEDLIPRVYLECIPKKKKKSMQEYQSYSTSWTINYDNNSFMLSNTYNSF